MPTGATACSQCGCILSSSEHSHWALLAVDAEDKATEQKEKLGQGWLQRFHIISMPLALLLAARLGTKTTGKKRATQGGIDKTYESCTYLFHFLTPLQIHYHVSVSDSLDGQLVLQPPRTHLAS